MSRRGNCWDNAPQESFFAILKTEMDLNKYVSYIKVAMGIAEYINYYNYSRPQLGLHKQTSFEVDQYLSEPCLRKLVVPAIIQNGVYG